ncbi:MAG: acyl carrier protein [Prevotellaceae bacterium]|nr:acyl carrier protein [Prevotellaceae bacterium]
MGLQEFIEKFAEAIEVEDVASLSGGTHFRDLDEWSSLSTMLLIAFYDEEFDKEIGGGDIKACQTISDLYKLATAS